MKSKKERRASTEVFKDEVRVGIDDIVIYQQLHECGFKSWCYGVKVPKWIYTQPSELLIKRGLTPNILDEEISVINNISLVRFTDSYGSWRTFTKTISAIIVCLFLILLAIPNTAARIFFVLVIFGVIIGNIINEKLLKPTDTAIERALVAVMEHVEVTLNNDYRKNNIHFGIAGRIHVIDTGCLCADTQHQYLHITISCADNVVINESDSDDDVINGLGNDTPIEVEEEQDRNDIHSIPNINGLKMRPDTPHPMHKKKMTKERDHVSYDMLEEVRESDVLIEEINVVPKVQDELKHSRPDTPYPMKGKRSGVIRRHSKNKKINALPELNEKLIDDMEDTVVNECEEMNDDEQLLYQSPATPLPSVSDAKQTRPGTPYPTSKIKIKKNSRMIFDGAAMDSLSEISESDQEEDVTLIEIGEILDLMIEKAITKIM